MSRHNFMVSVKFYDSPKAEAWKRCQETRIGKPGDWVRSGVGLAHALCDASGVWDMCHKLYYIENFEGVPVSENQKYQVGGKHYTDMAVQPWDVMRSVLTEAEFIGFLKGNIIKYGMRQGRKGSDDAEKCKHYQAVLKEELSRGT